MLHAVEHQHPTRYVNLEAARAKYGDRVDRFGAFLMRGDPLADEAADALAALDRDAREALVDRALREGIAAVPEAPGALVALFAQLDHVPYWVDFARCERGAGVFTGAGLLGGIVLGAGSLIGGYCSPTGNKPLVFSGRLRADVRRRLAETSRFVEVVNAPGGMRRHAEGFRACAKVRLMHASVRRLLQRSPAWRAREWGVPINQADASGTLLLFSLAVIQGLDKLGYVTRADEREDFLHLWRYAGWVLGVDPELLFATEAEAVTLWDLLSSTQEPPDADSRALAVSLIESGALGARDNEEREAIRKRIPAVYALSRYLIGDWYADHLGYPRSRWSAALPLFRLVNARVGSRLRRLGGLDHVAVDVGRRYWRDATTAALRGVPAAFAMPDHLGASP